MQDGCGKEVRVLRHKSQNTCRRRVAESRLFEFAFLFRFPQRLPPEHCPCHGRPKGGSCAGKATHPRPGGLRL